MFEIGSSLREARLRKGVDFTEAERGTKIRAKYLRALEDEQFDLLPGQTYAKGFLRSYAEYLGLDGHLYVDEYTSRFWVDEEGGGRGARRVRVRRRRNSRVERNMIGFTLLGIAIVTALVIAAWRFGGSDEAGKPSSIPNLAPAPAERIVTRPRAATLVVSAVDGNSLVEVHAQSAVGKLLYRGTLERGEAQRFVQRRLWLNVSSPKHLVLRLNGRSVELGGRCPRVVVVTAKQLTSTAACR